MSSDLSRSFDDIYRHGAWDKPYCSGPGSWHAPLLSAYIDSVHNFINVLSLSRDCTAVDLGCGDFNVGAQLTSYFASVLAIDVSQAIIARCKEFCILPNVEFLCADAREINLHRTDIIFLRQVLQHLSNKDIQQILINISKSCRYLLLTEHIPSGIFKPNADITSGSVLTRLRHGSGVDIMSAPFTHPFEPAAEVLNFYGFGGNIKTTAYANRILA